jgi:predicted N-acetyltransferase YhbS
MVPPVESLLPGDFPAAIAFLDRIFGEHGPHDFARMLPARYQPTSAHMRCQLALREGTSIVGLLGLFPIPWHLGRRPLSVAGVGGVSVEPSRRGQGLMGRLLEAARERARAEGYALLWLDGQRQRYGHHGYERAGTAVTLRLSPRSRAALGAVDPVTLTPLEADLTAAAVLAELHGRQPWRCERPREDFAAFLAGWGQVAFVASSAREGRVGYLTADPQTGTVHELVADTAAMRRAVAAAWVARRGDAVRILASTVFDPLVSALGPVAESLSLGENGNWLVLDWVTVLDTILGAVAEQVPDAMPPGSVVLEVTETGDRLELWVDGAHGGCTTSRRRPAVALPGATLVRLLFGPLPPTAVVPLPADAAALAAWCPLPLGVPRQDQV